MVSSPDWKGRPNLLRSSIGVVLLVPGYKKNNRIGRITGSRYLQNGLDA